MRCSRNIRIISGVILLLGASPVWAADTDKACSAPDVPLRPVMATHTIPPYPEVSVMTNEQGTTLLQVAIGPDGVPTKTTVVNSSGSLRLDAAAADYVKSSWRWNAPVKNCQPLAIETRVSIKWDLQDRRDGGLQPPTVNMHIKDYPPGALQRHEQGAVGLMIVVSPTGKVMALITQSSGFAELDDKSVELAKSWHWAPATLDGRAVLTPVFLVSVWRIGDRPR